MSSKQGRFEKFIVQAFDRVRIKIKDDSWPRFIFGDIMKRVEKHDAAHPNANLSLVI